MRNHKSSQRAKINWLLKNQKLWEGWPRGSDGSDPRHKEIVVRMKDAGLISQSTYYCDVTIDSLIKEARKQRRLASVTKVLQ